MLLGYMLFSSALFMSFCNFTCSKYPVAVLHGIASEAQNMNFLSGWLREKFEVTVFNLEIGNGYKTSLFTPASQQLNELCETIYNISELADGFNFIGMSQGGLLARGYTEQCNKYPVINLITLVSPHGGVFEPTFKINFYNKFYQDHLSFAGYWRDPKKINNYLLNSSYLAGLNNEEITQNSLIYQENIKKLQNFVLFWSPFDEILNPPESGKFSFFDSDYNVIAITDTELYKKDLLGLKFLNENNRFHIYETTCTHTQHRDIICLEQLYFIMIYYL